MELTSEIVGRIARRDGSRTEATLQADIRSLILAASLNLGGDDVVDVTSPVSLESQLGDGSRRRIDIETGSTVIEVKKSLVTPQALSEARRQLGNYVHERVAQTGTRYLGVLTDGRTWHLFVPDPDTPPELIEAGSPLVVESAADAERLIDWLGAVLATVEQVPPRADSIEAALGARSPAYAADHATLTALLASGDPKPEIQLKRRLWKNLLKTAFGSAFTDDESLFIDHTLLVIAAEIIAHAVIGHDVSRTGGLEPHDLVSGARFEEAWIHGVVESDFFDWPMLLPGGEDFIRSLAHRISRFDWTSAEVDHDVLKHLYESVISASSRKALGEYYTPDWLAQSMVDHAVTDALNDTVLDPSCGSGTFVFHAVRRHVEAQEANGVSPGRAVESAVAHVSGMDVHPVAVTLARVTYLLALGTSRLMHDERGEITVPIFLGDSVQWEQRRDLFAEHGVVTIHTADHELVDGSSGTLLEDDLIFPDELVEDAIKFDKVVREMAEKAMDTSATLDRTLITTILDRHKIEDAEQRRCLTGTFSTMRALHRTGNDHIWSYYVRNLVRPLWLALPHNRVDVLVGNPPWLRYSDMTDAMQQRYLNLCGERSLLSGPRGASGRDLSTLFVVRAIELYLRDGGTFSFVMPYGTMTRKPHDGFRSGSWALLFAAFATSWDLSPAPTSKATGFPAPACVVHGAKSDHGVRLSNEVDRWTVRKVRGRGSVSFDISREPASVYVLSSVDAVPESVYSKRFRSGAILYPRVLLFVEPGQAGPLGAGAGRQAVVSRRSEKPPWRDLVPLRGVVESQFIHDVHLGETVLPFRLLKPATVVLPIDPVSSARMLDLDDVQQHLALNAWWSGVEEAWRSKRRSNEKADLIDRVDYSSQLSAQFPLGGSVHRVVYTKSGNLLAASRLEGDRSLIENKLYWAAVDSAAEARYLVGILNSRAIADAVKPMQSLGLFGPRDFDKLAFRVPFPAFSPANEDHQLVASLVGQAEVLAAGVDLSAATNFKRARALIREVLEAEGLSSELEAAVSRVLPAVGT